MVEIDLFGSPIEERKAKKKPVQLTAPALPVSAEKYNMDCLYRPRPYIWWKESQYVTIIWNTPDNGNP